MLLKKIITLSLLVPLLASGDFIGGAFDKAVGKVTSKGVDKLQSSALDWVQTSATSGGTNFLFSSDTMSSFWNSVGGTYTTGTIEMCYKKAPLKSSATPDVCGMLGNTGFDACKVLPSTMGGGLYVKKSSSEQAKVKAPLSDWCKQALQSEVKTAAADIKLQMGLSGKKASAANKDAGFLSGAKKAVSDKSAGLTSYFDKAGNSSAAKGEGSAYAKKYRKLHEAGLGHVANNEIKKISALNKDISPGELDKVEFKIAFSSMEEYKNDLYAKTASDAAAQRAFFNFESHIDIVNSQFASLNQQKKLVGDKKNFIDEYVDNEQSGLRTQYRVWAEDMAEQEIAYTLPAKTGEKYYSSFDERNVLNNVSAYSRDKDVMISVANNEIVRQQYHEKTIMLKWRTLAEARADELKVILVKNMYASEVFNEAAARAEIQQLMSAK